MRSAVFLGGLAACALATLALAPHWGAVPIDGWAEAQRWLGPSEAWTGDTKIFAMRVARVALGFLAGRKWFSLSAMAASMVVLHNLQGWYPLLPLLRNLGVRTQQEIEQERMALKVLRGDHQAYQPQAIH